jgi:hypothetical protein
MRFHYSTMLALNFIRSLTGKPLLDDINTTPEDIANLKVVSAYAVDGGSHVSFKFKDQLYTMDIKVFQPKEIKVDQLLMANDVISKGGF